MYLISVVIPLFNKEKYIGRSISSVLEQSYINFELIIVDDGSTDNSLKIVEEFKDKRIRIIKKQNSGVSATRNIGIEQSKGEYIALLDADDYWQNDFLLEMSNLTNDYPQAALYCSNYFVVSESKVRIKNTKIKTGVIKNYFQIAHYNTLVTSSSVLIPKSTLFSTGLFDEKIANGEDLHLWFRIVDFGNIIYLHKPLMYYYLNCSTNESKNFKRNIKKDILYYINNLNIQNPGWCVFKNNFVARNLKPYYFLNYEEIEIEKVMNQIDFSKVYLLNKFIYLIPKKLISGIYLWIYKIKYL